MKRFFLPIAVAALCGFSQAQAKSADYAQVEPKLKASDTRVEQVAPKTEYFGSKDNKSINPSWHYVRIPYVLQGKSRGDKAPLYVDELKVKAYVVFAVGKDGEDLIMLNKEITYVNIPLTPKGELSENKNVQAAVFISPSDAARICANDSSKVERVDLSDKLAAVAVEFRFKDADCVKSDSEVSVLVNKKLKNRLQNGWWKKNANNKVAAQLLAISETPFAPFYAPAFPQTSPMYGSGAGGYTPASSGTSDATPTTPTTPTPATTEADTDTESGADAEEDSDKKKKKSGSKKSKKRRK